MFQTGYPNTEHLWHFCFVLCCSMDSNKNLGNICVAFLFQAYTVTAVCIYSVKLSIESIQMSNHLFVGWCVVDGLCGYH